MAQERGGKDEWPITVLAEKRLEIGHDPRVGTVASDIAHPLKSVARFILLGDRNMPFPGMPGCITGIAKDLAHHRVRPDGPAPYVEGDAVLVRHKPRVPRATVWDAERLRGIRFLEANAVRRQRIRMGRV